MPSCVDDPAAASSLNISSTVHQAKPGPAANTLDLVFCLSSVVFSLKSVAFMRHTHHVHQASREVSQSNVNMQSIQR